jgi:hypothetical protein
VKLSGVEWLLRGSVLFASRALARRRAVCVVLTFVDRSVSPKSSLAENMYYIYMFDTHRQVFDADSGSSALRA